MAKKPVKKSSGSEPSVKEQAIQDFLKATEELASKLSSEIEIVDLLKSASSLLWGRSAVIEADDLLRAAEKQFALAEKALISLVVILHAAGTQLRYTSPKGDLAQKLLLQRLSAETVQRAAAMTVIQTLENWLNQLVKPGSDEDRYNYAVKLHWAQVVNDMLRSEQAAVAHPKTNEPCILLAVTSHDGAGRYTLESRLTKKRSGSYRSLSESLPFKLIADVPRKVAPVERRAKKADDDIWRDEPAMHGSHSPETIETKQTSRKKRGGRKPP
jgi:hypothetical protein